MPWKSVLPSGRRGSGLNPNSEGATLLPMGSTGDPPVPTGDPPVGTGGCVRISSGGWFYGHSTLCSVGPVAQRDGQVARATQFHLGNSRPAPGAQRPQDRGQRPDAWADPRERRPGIQPYARVKPWGLDFGLNRIAPLGPLALNTKARGGLQPSVNLIFNYHDSAGRIGWRRMGRVVSAHTGATLA